MIARRTLLLLGGLIVLSLAVGVAWWLGLLGTEALTAGPMVQSVGPHGFTVVWRTDERGESGLQLMDGDRATLRVPARLQDGRYLATVRGLEPGRAYVYRVVIAQDGNTRVLGGPWSCKTDPGPGAAFQMAVFGDSGTGGRAQYRVARCIAARPIDLIVHTGDLVYDRGEAADYPDKFFEPYAEMLPSIPFMPVIGNHDYATDRGRPLLDAFVLPRNGPAGTDPERHYWFDYGCARFAAIDTDVDEAELRDRVAPWLVEVFASAGGRWRFVYTHHPLYTGSTARGPSEPIQRALAPAFDRAGVDVAFAGHNHLYERSKPIQGGKVVGGGRGIVYVVTGAGGAKLRPTRPRAEWPDYVETAYDDDHSYTHVLVSPTSLALTQINSAGETVDTWRLERKRTPTTNAP